MKTKKKIKARKMVLNNTEECPKVFVLPADRTSVAEMVDQIAAAIWATHEGMNPHTFECLAGVTQCRYVDLARASLTAIGIKPRGSK